MKIRTILSAFVIALVSSACSDFLDTSIDRNSTGETIQTNYSAIWGFDRALKRYVQLVSNPAFTRENRLLSLRKVMEIARTSEQKALILRQIQRADTFLALMYASEFLDSSDAAVRSAAVYAVWNIARNHPEYKGALKASYHIAVKKIEQFIKEED